MSAEPANRDLTADEKDLVRWMLEHGEPDAVSYLAQLEQVRVTPERCPCGCASLCFSITGKPEPTGGMHLLGDFAFGSPDDLKGIFVYEQDGILAGLEVWGVMGDAPRELPTPGMLQPLDATTGE